jgi:MFS family permease
MPGALGILGAAYPPGKRKNKAFSAFSAGFPTGFALGLVLGGLLTSYVSWRWGVRIVAIIAAGFTTLGVLVIPSDPPRTDAQRKEKVDWLGAILVTCSIVSICYALMYITLNMKN